MTWTRQALRQRIGSVGMCGDMILGTTSALGNTTALIDTTQTSLDNAFNYGEVVITSGAASGDIRDISSWTQSTGTLVPNRAFSNTIAASTTYELHREFSATKKNKAINQAIYDSKLRWARRIEDESITQAASTMTYSLANMTVSVDTTLGIDELYSEVSSGITGDPWDKIDEDDYSIRNDDGALTLQLRVSPPNPTYLFRVVYRTRPRVFTTDTGTNNTTVVGTLEPDQQDFADYVCARATALLYRDRALRGTNDTKRDIDWQIYQEFAAMAEQYLSADKPAKQPGKVKYARWAGDVADNLDQYTQGDVSKVRLP